jgi:hypothetical protein
VTEPSLMQRVRRGWLFIEVAVGFIGAALAAGLGIWIFVSFWPNVLGGPCTPGLTSPLLLALSFAMARSARGKVCEGRLSRHGQNA